MKNFVLDFPEEFYLECRMKMSEKEFDFWFEPQQDCEMMYVSVSVLGRPNGGNETLCFEGEDYGLLVRSTNRSDGFEVAVYCGYGPGIAKIFSRKVYQNIIEGRDISYGIGDND